MSNNKTLMQLDMDYVHQNDKAIEMLKQINFACLKKKTWLSCELVGFMGRSQTSCCMNMQETSSLQW